VALFTEVVDEFGADEAGAADDNDFHGFVFGVKRFGFFIRGHPAPEYAFL